MSDYVWQPVEDGEYGGQHVGSVVEVSGKWMAVRHLVYDTLVHIALPDDLRLCRRVPAPAQGVPDNVARDMHAICTHSQKNDPDSLLIRQRNTVRLWLVTRPLQEGVPEEVVDAINGIISAGNPTDADYDAWCEYVRRIDAWLDAQEQEAANE